MTNNFTPTQQAMLKILQDGLFHPRSELAACIDDTDVNANQFHQALSRLRKELDPHNYTVSCEVRKRRFYYRLVGLVRKAPAPRSGPAERKPYLT